MCVEICSLIFRYGLETLRTIPERKKETTRRRQRRGGAAVVVAYIQRWCSSTYTNGMNDHFETQKDRQTDRPGLSDSDYRAQMPTDTTRAALALLLRRRGLDTAAACVVVSLLEEQTTDPEMTWCCAAGGRRRMSPASVAAATPAHKLARRRWIQYARVVVCNGGPSPSLRLLGMVKVPFLQQALLRFRRRSDVEDGSEGIQRRRRTTQTNSGWWVGFQLAGCIDRIAAFPLCAIAEII